MPPHGRASIPFAQEASKAGERLGVSDDVLRQLSDAPWVRVRSLQWAGKLKYERLGLYDTLEKGVHLFLDFSEVDEELRGENDLRLAPTLKRASFRHHRR
jgi:hypothetical protein